LNVQVQMKQSAWWRKQHAKRMQVTEQDRSSAVRGPVASGLRGLGMQQLAQEDAGSKKSTQQKLVAAAPREHTGMAQV